MPHKDPDQRKEYFKAYDAKRKGRGLVANMTPEQIERQRKSDRKRRNEYQRKWNERQGGQGYKSLGWKGQLRIKYGLTPEEFELMLSYQKGCCAACGTRFEGVGGSRSDRVAIDHCHIMHIVRGLLCGSCNRTIGHSQENIERLRRCADYLEFGGDL